MKSLRFLASIAVVACTTGCATVITSPLQKIEVNSRPAGADVRVDGISKGTTPAAVELPRWRNHQVSIELEGYRPYEVKLHRSFNPWFLANVSNGFILGLIVDLSTGAVYELQPDEISIEMLRARRVRSAGAHAQVVIATTLQPKAHWRKVGQLERL